MYATMAGECQQSFISKLHFSISNGMPHAEPLPSFKADEKELVHGILQMLQGFCSHLFYWDEEGQKFLVKSGIFVCHLSQTSLRSILDKFLFCGTCLKKVELFVKKVKASRQRAPTLEAFANSVHSWLKRVRDLALKEEIKSTSIDCQITITLLQLTNSLSSLCSGAEYLAQVVYGSIPNACINSELAVPANKIAVIILDSLFKKLNEAYLVPGGEEKPYHMLLSIMVECMLPYLEVLDLWLYEGFLDDPCEEVFFYANNAVTVDQPTYWETSYLFRPKSNKTLADKNIKSTIPRVWREQEGREAVPMSFSARGGDQNEINCPIFLKELARPIVSAGKSLQLIQHVRGGELDVPTWKNSGGQFNSQQYEQDAKSNTSKANICDERFNYAGLMGILTLPEAFLVSLTGLVGDGDHIYPKLTIPSTEITEMIMKGVTEDEQTSLNHEKTWIKFLADAITGRRKIGCGKDDSLNVGIVQVHDSIKVEPKCNSDYRSTESKDIDILYPHIPIMTVSRQFIEKHKDSWSNLNISQYIRLPPLNDENLRMAIYTEKFNTTDANIDSQNGDSLRHCSGTDYTFGFQHSDVQQLLVEKDIRNLECLYSFPTFLPSFQEDVPVSDLLPFQKNSTLSRRILSWIQDLSLNVTPQPDVIIKECVVVYIKTQMDQIGRHMLLKLMTDWKLMDELNIIRSIYLLGSGDLLQRFLIVVFGKIDEGESWDDDFELNTILQESIRNSADSTLLSSPDSLVVSISQSDALEDDENKAHKIANPRRGFGQFFGIDALDLLKFSYKVSWPLDLIVNSEALKKYNQVMGFLLKVKRAKYLLDKVRRWMWKGRTAVQNHKHHLLVEQKLLHFVDAFHQYVMDRVFHSAWIELCTTMSSAGSLDEVIEAHEAYLSLIQRQCFVGPDKLWALIASRVKSILGLVLDFHSIQQTLHSVGAAPAIRARCEMEVDRIEKQFDDCMAFLLRILSFKINVGHFPHLADLVTRINYNYFYMSDTGNLLNVPSFEGAKPGRSLIS
ncbi:gamma-tubulin complex component 5-like [Phalaenopsis equestris]|uniref:gamma-tubulin complex component 5-like n=1 Tax=Phalaenopsis equestris TaxID=78828 RepID=UPI0009E4C77A|nr:gamma-tubulin complex component 5-like [Phalaenopsis equestris]XP_020589376.1 gamma-tubulin complex component 5-like [Phalaenopsis equestris]XP_020589378.1 gamma-tubulin complex component 5-like [Phalaenopsis equestris]XP_020589379.1 gamma-tubulin complex component 5-like [Phalaenopsis equestris]